MAKFYCKSLNCVNVIDETDIVLMERLGYTGSYCWACLGFHDKRAIEKRLEEK